MLLDRAGQEALLGCHGGGQKYVLAAWRFTVPFRTLSKLC